ncbi:MAG TPA: hypothetical protein VLA42_15240 [Verrucomicrobiae bacterium]|nr:hypothetical protein [Verrucomicrobiae bacterium]
MFLKITVAGLFLAGVLSGSIAAGPAPTDHHSSNMSGGEHGPVADCASLHIRINDRAAEIRSEARTIARLNGPLSVESEVNGGVQVQGWDKDTYSVTACKAADASGNDVERIFSQIKLSVENGRVSVSGPSEHDNWTVFLLVRAPRSANLVLRANNGPLSIYHLDGKLEARAINGPISLQGFSGEANISAENGPIDLVGNSGKLRLHTENGPISVSLSGEVWKGSGLEADAQNGPLTLRVPKNYQSSLLVESDGHSPMSCQASFCNDARKTWDEDRRRIEFGNAPAVIHLSTVNGPIAVKQI